MWFELSGYRYSIDYRIPAGLDTWIDDATFTSIGHADRPRGGVALHRQKLGAQPRLVMSSTCTRPGRWSGRYQPPPWPRGEGLSAARMGRSPCGGRRHHHERASRLSYPTLGKVTRWSGPDRFATSAQISKASYPAGVPVAYIASGRVYPDALSAAPVAGMRHGPILLVDTDAIPAVIAEELRRLAPQEIVVLGGTATLTAAVETAADAFTTGLVRR